MKLVEKCQYYEVEGSAQAVHSLFFSFFRAFHFFFNFLISCHFFIFLINDNLDGVMRSRISDKSIHEIVLHWTSANSAGVMTFFCSSLAFAWKIGHLRT